MNAAEAGPLTAPELDPLDAWWRAAHTVYAVIQRPGGGQQTSTRACWRGPAVAAGSAADAGASIAQLDWPWEYRFDHGDLSLDLAG